MASARSVYTEEAMAEDAGAFSSFPSLESVERIRAQDTEAYWPPYFSSELVEVQQRQCRRMHERVSPYDRIANLNVEVCSVTPNKCGWVKADLGGTNSQGKNFGPGEFVEIQLCDREYYHRYYC